jgi:hypothetical protein
MSIKILIFIILTTIIACFTLICKYVPLQNAPTSVIVCKIFEEKNCNSLQAAIKVISSSNVGSGTIIYYKDKTAYAISAGHMWTKGAKCEVEYEGKKITAELLFYEDTPGFDCSLLTFPLDERPEYFPIAPENHIITVGQQYNSPGCDNNASPTNYEVEYMGVRKLNTVEEPVLTTAKNSPKPGRSGGGLLDNKYLVGVCFATSARDGTGYGFFTSLSSIRHTFAARDYGWLLDVNPHH